MEFVERREEANDSACEGRSLVDWYVKKFDITEIQKFIAKQPGKAALISRTLTWKYDQFWSHKLHTII
jgi:hypothetical protein